MLVAATPFLLAAFAWTEQGGELSGSGLLGRCPMLELTGLPCAGCGGSRAYFHLIHGNAAVFDYNWFWPLATLALFGYGAILTMRAARGRDLFGRLAQGAVRRFAEAPWRTGAATAAVFAVPWIIAFINLSTIDVG